MSETQQPTLLVTGASGHMGRRVVELLLEAHAGTIVAMTRTPEKLADFADQGVIVRYGTFDEPDSLAQAFAGVDRLLLISTDVLDVPGKRLKQHVTAVKAAAAAQVKHVVYTSIVKADDTPVLLAADHIGTERALADTSMGWTSLRVNIYTEMLIFGLSRAYQMGGLYNACGDGKTAYVTREDCARAAVAALTAPFDGNRILNITGPEALSQAEIAALASSITGTPLPYVALGMDAVIQAMVDAGLPRPAAESYASFDLATAQGIFAAVSGDFEALTGRKPQGIADFLAANKAALSG